MKNIKIEVTNERIIPAGGLTVVGAILGKSNFVKRCNRMDITPNRSQHQIKNSDILLSYIGMLCMGKPQFQAVREMDDDRDFYKSALGIAYNIPSEETLCQRMDDIGSSQREHILAENVELLRSNGIVHFKFPNGLVLKLTILAYNILRMIGQESIGRRKTRHKVHRRRLRTGISNMIMMSSYVTEHARQSIMGLGKNNVWRDTFAEIYTAFEKFSM